MHLKCLMFQKVSPLCWLYSPRHWGIFSATSPPAPTSPGTGSLLLQLGLARGLQVQPKVCLTWLVLLEYCEPWAGCSTTSKGARPPLASTEASLGPWRVSNIAVLVPELQALLAQVQKDVLAWTLCCTMFRIFEIVSASADSSTP